MCFVIINNAEILFAYYPKLLVKNLWFAKFCSCSDPPVKNALNKRHDFIFIRIKTTAFVLNNRTRSLSKAHERAPCELYRRFKNKSVVSSSGTKTWTIMYKKFEFASRDTSNLIVRITVTFVSIVVLKYIINARLEENKTKQNNLTCLKQKNKTRKPFHLFK